MSRLSSKIVGLIIPIAVSSMGVVSMTVAARLLNNGSTPVLTISEHHDVNLTLTMQLMVLPISFVALAIMFLYDRARFKEFFRWGNSKESGWSATGPVIVAGFTLGTVMLMSFGVMSQNGIVNASFFSLLPWVLFFAATNAWSEEIFSRFVIVAGLHGKLSPITICWISAAIFGIPHFFGTPSGLFGVIGAGFLGWLLAKSVIETKGLGWALFIHFLQDVVIFGAGAMILAGK